MGVSAAVVGRSSLKVNMTLNALRVKMPKSEWLLMYKHTWLVITQPPTVVALLYLLLSKELPQAHGGILDLIQKFLKANIEVVPLDK